MRTKTKRFTLGSTGVAAIATAALIFATTGSEATPTGPMTTARGSEATPTGPMTTAQIKSLVMTDAAGMGDSTPTDISYSALTTRNTALAAIDGGGQIGGADGTARGYYLVVAHGNFTATDAEVPNGVAYPTGTVLTLVVDASTGQPTDSGIQRNTPDMSKVGPVTTIASN
jgi:hypothetical protein